MASRASAARQVADPVATVAANVEARIDAEAAAAGARSARQRVMVWDAEDDLVVAARDLYARMRTADEAGMDVIVAVLPPAIGLGHAIRDRLTKAASPR